MDHYKVFVKVMHSASLEFQDTFQAHIQQQCLAQLVSNSAKKVTDFIPCEKWRSPLNWHVPLLNTAATAAEGNFAWQLSLLK